jgi:hypothetical protein
MSGFLIFLWKAANSSRWMNSRRMHQAFEKLKAVNVFVN